jgi:PAS domain S-box-containing protein
MKEEKNKKILIELSHDRCKNRSLSSKQLYSKKILNDVEVQKRLTLNRKLILTATPYIEQLSNFVKGSNFFVLLTDGEGCILNAIGEEDILGEAFEMKMVPGAFMDEENIGTNAMSMILTERKPIQISGKEHYIKAYHKWNCSAAPVKNIYGNIVGVINLTGYIENVHPHTLGMVVSAANAIEEMLKVKQYNNIFTLTSNHMKNIFDKIPIGIITTDIDGKIRTVNKKVLKMFGFKEEKMKEINISELIVDFHRIKNTLYKGKEFDNEDVRVNAQSNKMKFNITAYPSYNSNEDIVEIIFIIQEKKQKRKLENKIMAGQAIYTFEKIIGSNENFYRIINYAKKISDSKSTILIMGESGTGKELFAQSIHNYSSRMDEVFVAVNCGAIPRELMEAELFGYEEGAFTGAKRGGSPGKFEIADGGTIFLDEIGEMPFDMQTKLLRVIEEGIVNRIGSIKPILVNVRIIAATNRDLKKEVEKGNFRKDLYYRLNVLPIYLPPLRKRKDDIPQLIDYFMEVISNKLNKKQVEISEKDLIDFINYDWPGNIRELQNIIELIINTEGIPVNLFNKEIGLEECVMDISLEDLKLENVEKHHISKVIKKYKGNITKAASVLGIGRNTLYSKLNKYRIRE